MVATGTNNSSNASISYLKGEENQQINGTTSGQLQVEERHNLSSLHQSNKTAVGQIEAMTQELTLQGEADSVTSAKQRNQLVSKATTRQNSEIDPTNKTSIKKLEKQALRNETSKNVHNTHQGLRQSQPDERKISLPNSSDNDHFSNVAFLDLQPWEKASILSMDAFPSNTPEFCAIGTISFAGALKQSSGCKKSDYDIVQRHLRQEIPKTESAMYVA